MSNSSALAVSMMIGTALRARIWRQTSKPSSFGQHHVEHDEVERAVAEALERLLPVDGGNHLVALLAQRIREQLLDRLLVVDQEDPGGLCATCLRRGSASYEIVGWRSVVMPEP